MSEINPKIEDNEPVCSFSEECKNYKSDLGMCSYTPAKPIKGFLCVPGLREQRDEYKLELEKVEKELQQYIIWHGELKAERDELKKRVNELEEQLSEKFLEWRRMELDDDSDDPEPMF